MAEDGKDRDSDDLSEEASQYRLEEFRTQGKVAQSREVIGFVLFVGISVVLLFVAENSLSSIYVFMKQTFNIAISYPKMFERPENLGQGVWESVALGLKIILPVSGVGFALGISASLLQVGFVYSTEPLGPDWNKLNFVQGLSRYVSTKIVIDTLKLTLKIIIMAALSYWLIQDELTRAGSLLFTDLRAQLPFMGKIAIKFAFQLGAVYGVFAAIDYGQTRYEFMKQARLTKPEAKQEAKEKEGDPLLKARIRALQRDTVRKRMMQNVKKATVIITNPTHLAIALEYDKDSMNAPRVLAKGADLIALRIREEAQKFDIPIIENVPLARTLFKTVKVGALIPRSLYQAVAEVLAFVYKLKHRGNS